MGVFNDKDKIMLEKFIKDCMEKDILEVKRRIHRVWDAQEEMLRNNLMILNRITPKNIEYTGGGIRN